jgi:DUF1016 N-terminal domain
MEKGLLRDQKIAYEGLIERISTSYTAARAKAARVVNESLLNAYWEIGRYMVEFEQKGNDRAGYGKNLLETLARDLSLMHGKGFGVDNLQKMRQLYRVYPKYASVPRKLSWSHCVEILKIDDPLERNFYEKQAVLENWSTREL